MRWWGTETWSHLAHQGISGAELKVRPAMFSEESGYWISGFMAFDRGDLWRYLSDTWVAESLDGVGDI